MNLTDALQSENINEIIDRMNAYAISMLKSVGVKDFNGKEPIDFVGDTLLKVMEGTRDWNKADCSLKEFLFGCLKSEISNFFKSQKVHSNAELPDIPVNGNSSNIEEKRNQVCDLLRMQGADELEIRVFECWMDGIFKPIKIAEELGISVKEVNVITKRLERKRKKIEHQALNII